MSPGRGILAIWHGIRPDRVAETLSWYDREHHLERLAIPGFRSLRRYHAVEADRFLFIRYETDAAATLSSPDYLARLNAPTPWTMRSQPGFLDNVRSVCVRESRDGWAEGGFAVTARLTSLADESEAAPDWQAAKPALLGLDGVVGAELWRADRRASRLASGEKRLRGREDGYVDWAIVVHATSLDGARAARDAIGTADPAGFAVETGIYYLAAASFHDMS